MEPAPIATPGLPEKGPDASPAAKRPPEPVTAGEYRATAFLFLIFVVNIALAAWFSAPFRQAGLKAFADPEDPTNILVYAVLIFAFTALILWLARKKLQKIIQWIILIAVGSTIFYVVGPLIDLYGPTDLLVFDNTRYLGFAVGLAVGAASVALLYIHPEWWVIDAVGILVAAGSAAIFGISLSVALVILLLVGLAVYDAIAVYRTKHMLSLADTVIGLRLPVLLVIPKHRGYRFRAEASKFKEAKAENKGERDAMFMGLGDLVMPTLLVIASMAFLGGLTTLPLAAADVHSFNAAGLPLDVDASDGTGHPLTVTYTIASTQPDSGGWDWKVVWQDGSPDSMGKGLPATVNKTYAEPGYVRANVSATASNQATGSVLVDVGADYPDESAWTPIKVLLNNAPALGAAIGTLVGFLVLMGFVLRGNPQAGLPLLNGGAITGFLIGLYSATGSIVFW